MKELLTQLVVITLICCSSASPLQEKSIKKLNNRPIIAVLAQKDHALEKNQSYIAASYVKYLEASGARVVPIPHYYTETQVAELFNYVNGVLFPGGGIEFFVSDYYKLAKVFWDHALKSNDNGNFFPIWGTCMGFETLHVLQAEKDVMTQRISKDKALALDFLPGARDSKLLKHASSKMYEILGHEKVTFNHHSMGVTMDTYIKHTKLGKFFNILSVNLDEYNKVFVSTVEAYDYPIYGVQWHPEKNNFEHYEGYNELPGTAHGVMTSQYMANFFVNEARKNHHKFPTQEEEDKHLIYNYNPVYSAKKYKGPLSHFEQIYLF